MARRNSGRAGRRAKLVLTRGAKNGLPQNQQKSRFMRRAFPYKIIAFFFVGFHSLLRCTMRIPLVIVGRRRRHLDEVDDERIVDHRRRRRFLLLVPVLRRVLSVWSRRRRRRRLIVGESPSKHQRRRRLLLHRSRRRRFYDGLGVLLLSNGGESESVYCATFQLTLSRLRVSRISARDDKKLLSPLPLPRARRFFASLRKGDDAIQKQYLRNWRRWDCSPQLGGTLSRRGILKPYIVNQICIVLCLFASVCVGKQNQTTQNNANQF